MAICAKIIKSASANIDYAKLALVFGSINSDFFFIFYCSFIMTVGAIWQLLSYLHAKATVDADDSGDNGSEEVPAADLNMDSKQHTPFFLLQVVLFCANQSKSSQAKWLMLYEVMKAKIML